MPSGYHEIKSLKSRYTIFRWNRTYLKKLTGNYKKDQRRQSRELANKEKTKLIVMPTKIYLSRNCWKELRMPQAVITINSQLQANNKIT